eukprot:s376_g31.t1
MVGIRKTGTRSIATVPKFWLNRTLRTGFAWGELPTSNGCAPERWRMVLLDCVSGVVSWGLRMGVDCLGGAVQMRCRSRISKEIVEPLESRLWERVRCRDSCEVGKISGHDESLESLLSGEAIREELRDTNSNLEETVTKCTRKAKAEIKKWVIFFVSFTGHGKSTLIGHALEELGIKGAPATGCRGSVTKAVKGYVATVDGWTTGGLTEEVIFMDSPGWQWGRSPKDVEDQLVTMRAIAADMGVAPDTLKERLVVVLLHRAEDVARDLENQNFSAFLAAFFKACRNQNATLVPVLTKAEPQRCSVEDLDFSKNQLQTKLESLSKEHSECVTVRRAMCWSNTSRPSAKELCDALAKACHQHLKSEAVRGKVMKNIESELLKILQDWAKKGDSRNALANRFVWVCARHRGLRLKHVQLNEDTPWEDAAKVVDSLKKQPLRHSLEDATDDWHSDELRRLKKAPATPGPVCSGCSKSRCSPPISSKPPSRPVGQRQAAACQQAATAQSRW